MTWRLIDFLFLMVSTAFVVSCRFKVQIPQPQGTSSQVQSSMTRAPRCRAPRSRACPELQVQSSNAMGIISLGTIQAGGLLPRGLQPWKHCCAVYCRGGYAVGILVFGNITIWIGCRGGSQCREPVPWGAAVGISAVGMTTAKSGVTRRLLYPFG